MINSANTTKRRASRSVLLFLLASGCHTVEGSGEVVSEERAVEDFERISLRGRGTIHFTQASETAVVIEAEDNIVKRLVTRVEDHKLILRQRENVILDPTEPIRYHVSAPTLTRVVLDGNGRFESDALEVESIAFEIDGSGEVAVSGLIADRIGVDVDGHARMNVAGVAGTQNVEVDGAGRYFALELETARADVDVDGRAKATVYVTDELRVEVDGTGHVDYRGAPSVRRDVDGGGKLHSID